MSNLYPDQPTNAQNFWQNVHGIVLTVLWCLGADALLIIVRYYKNWQKYILLHSLFGVINILTVIVVVVVVVLDRAYLFNAAGFASMTLATQIHFIIGMCFIFCIVGVQILGLFVKAQLESPNEDPGAMLRKKKIHKIIGYTLYAISKPQLVLGWYVPGPGWSPMMFILLVYYIIFFSFKFFYLERLYIKEDEKLYHSFYKGKSAALMSEFETIGQMLQNGISRRKIREDFPDTKYVMFRDKLYNVAGLLHPGGMSIIDAVIGEEVSRYIYGAYGHEMLKSEAHKHTIFAKKHLQEMFACQLDLSNLKLLVPQIGDKTNVPALWKLRKTVNIGKGTKNFLFETDRYRVNPKPNILYLGRHFLLTPPDDSLAPRLYTLALCTSPHHRQYIDSICHYLDNPVGDPVLHEMPQTINELPFVIKQYKVGGFSEYLHNLPMGQEVRIDGPFGRGLELQEGHFVAFCGGTGVLPLLDLIYEILLEVFRKVTKSTRITRLPLNFRLTLYLSVNFPEDLEGLDIILKTHKYCQKFMFDNFKAFIRVSKGKAPEGINKVEGRFDNKKITEVIKSQEFTTALVCGSPEMNNMIGGYLQNLMPKNTIHIL